MKRNWLYITHAIKASRADCAIAFGAFGGAFREVLRTSVFGYSGHSSYKMSSSCYLVIPAKAGMTSEELIWPSFAEHQDIQTYYLRALYSAQRCVTRSMLT